MWVTLNLLAVTLCVFAVGCGLLAVLAVLAGSSAMRRMCCSADLALGAGLALLLAVTVVAGPVPQAAIWAGAAVGGWILVSGHATLARHESRVVNWGAVLLASSALLAAVWQPLVEWDARSIWYHQAKILFFHGPDWDYFRTAAFTHPDYPKLLPSTAALVAEGLGAWSDPLAKFASFLVVLPLVIASLRLSRGAAMAFQACLAVSLYQVGNGYLDAPLALGTLVALALATECSLGRTHGGSPEAKAERMAAALILAGLCLNMKNEGVVAIAGSALCLTLTGWRRGFQMPLRGSEAAAFAFVALAPYCLWTVIKAAEGLHGDLLAGGAAGALDRASARLMAGDLLLIFRAIMIESHIAWLWAGAVLAWWLPGPIRSQRRWWAATALASSFLYAAVLGAVYLTTPFDVRWHLATSASRVTLLPAFLAVLGLAHLIVASTARQQRSGNALPCGASEPGRGGVGPILP